MLLRNFILTPPIKLAHTAWAKLLNEKINYCLADSKDNAFELANNFAARNLAAKLYFVFW